MYVHCTYIVPTVRTMYVHCTYSARWDVFYEMYKHQLSYTLYDARRLFAITYILEIHMYVFRHHPGEIVNVTR